MDKKCGTLQNFDEVHVLIREAPWSNEQIASGYRPFLASDAAEDRAKVIVTNSRTLNINWNLGLTSMKTEHELWVPCYEIPNSDFGAPPSSLEASAVHKAHGIGLNWGSLLRFGRACETVSKLFEKGLPAKVRNKLANPKDHLATVEEIIWLGLWQHVSDIESEVQLGKKNGNKKRVDWKFKSKGQTINLEVKYRMRDWVRVADGPQFSIARPSYYEDIDGKFPERLPSELNIVGISSYAAPDRSWREETHDYLDKNPQIDAIVLWSPTFVGDGGAPFEVHSRDKASIVRNLLRPIEEDKQHLVVIRHLWQERDQRRLDNKPHIHKALMEYSRRAEGRLLENK